MTVDDFGDPRGLPGARNAATTLPPSSDSLSDSSLSLSAAACACKRQVHVMKFFCLAELLVAGCYLLLQLLWPCAIRNR